MSTKCVSAVWDSKSYDIRAETGTGTWIGIGIEIWDFKLRLEREMHFKTRIHCNRTSEGYKVPMPKGTENLKKIKLIYNHDHDILSCTL